MRIDKSKLDELTRLSDEELWNQIKKIASSHGFPLSDKMPSQTEMNKIRQALSNGANLKLGEAVRILNEFKRGKR